MDEICKLCGQKSPLIKAHILPKLMFKSVFDEKHRIVSVDFINQEQSKEQSDAGYDFNLFCKYCDTVTLGKLDNYFAEKIMGKRGVSGKKEISEKHIDLKGDVSISELSGLDYNKLKLFFLSILLRSSLTKNKFFHDVDVRNIHEDLKNMINIGIACSEKKFRVCMFKLEPNEDRPYMSVIGPRKSRKNGNTYYAFYINTYAIFINISDYNLTPIFEQGYLNEKGEMYLFNLKGIKAKSMFDSLMGRGVVYNGPFKSA